MDIHKVLDELEEKYYGDWAENKETLFAELDKIHREISPDRDLLNRFIVQINDRFGGAYIPFVFWDKLAEFLSKPEQRTYLYEIIKAFANSDFDEEEQKRMKPLLITYFANEKQFEIDKIHTLVIDKAHPSVKEYFFKLFNFVRKNQRSTEMYCNKFMLLKNIHPDFEMMAMPITQLKDQLQEA